MPRKPQQVPRSLADHVEVAVSAALQTAPFCGGLARYLDEYFPDQQKRAVADLVACIRQHAQDIETVVCDLEKLRGLVNQVIVSSLQTSSDQKREAFRAVLLNYARGKSGEEDGIDLFLQMLTSVTELQIRLLKAARGVRKSDYPEPRWQEGPFINEKFREIRQDILTLAYFDLMQRGLVIAPYTTVGPRPKPIPMWAMELTPLGRAFLEWITTSDSESKSGRPD